MVANEKTITGTIIKTKAIVPVKNNPAREMTAAILKRQPPSLCVFSQTISFYRVQGVRIPINQFRFNLSKNTPIKNHRAAIAGIKAIVKLN